MNYLRSFRPAVIFLTLLAFAGPTGSAMHDDLPNVSANSYAGPAGSPHEVSEISALSVEDELDIRGPVSPALADFVAEALALNTPVVLGKSVDVDVSVRNEGDTPTDGYDLVFYFTQDDGATRIVAETSEAASGPYSSVAASASDFLSVSIEVPGSGTFSVGAYELCVLIQATDSAVDKVPCPEGHTEDKEILPGA